MGKIITANPNNMTFGQALLIMLHLKSRFQVREVSDDTQYICQ